MDVDNAVSSSVEPTITHSYPALPALTLTSQAALDDAKARIVELEDQLEDLQFSKHRSPLGTWKLDSTSPQETPKAPPLTASKPTLLTPPTLTLIPVLTLLRPYADKL